MFIQSKNLIEKKNAYESNWYCWSLNHTSMLNLLCVIVFSAIWRYPCYTLALHILFIVFWYMFLDVVEK